MFEELHPDVLNYKLNWKKEEPDDRDLLYKVQAPFEIPSVIPSKHDLLGFMPPVFDQGSLGSCTGNGISAAIGYLRFKQPDLEDWVPSRLLIYYLERMIEHNIKEDAGAQIRDGIKVVGKYGTVPESEYPYLIEKFAEEPPHHIMEAATKHKAYNYYRVDWSDWDEVVGCIAAGFPIVFGFNVYKEFMSRRVAKTGILPMPADPKHSEGGHCVLAIGYDKDFHPSEWDEPGGVLIRNSWGEGWALKGNFWMPKKYITSPDLSDDFWTIRATF